MSLMSKYIQMMSRIEMTGWDEWLNLWLWNRKMFLNQFQINYQSTNCTEQFQLFCTQKSVYYSYCSESKITFNSSPQLTLQFPPDIPPLKIVNPNVC
jgi:hypothetical protein